MTQESGSKGEPNNELKGARRSIRAHMIVGLVVMLVLTCGFGGWASTVPISGALIAPGAVVVDSNVQESAAPDRRRGRRSARA